MSAYRLSESGRLSIAFGVRLKIWELPADEALAAELLAIQSARMKAGRTAADFGLQAIQRAVVLATVYAAGQVTHSGVIIAFGWVAWALFFVWFQWSIGGAVRWLRRELNGRSRLLKVATFAVAGGECVLIGLLITAVSAFSDAMTVRLAGS